jgi:FKBP-type peptidyl-prolyl cis-trans isomerase SlpA
MSETIQADSLVTLHYRVAMEDGEELVSTFERTPATLQMGNGELSPMLEKCVVGLNVGERRRFLLEPDQGFGQKNPQLVQRMPRSQVPKSIVPMALLGQKEHEVPPMAVNSLIEFAAPSGQKFSGIVREMDEETVLVDFNHPLAGRKVCFEVQVIGIM